MDEPVRLRHQRSLAAPPSDIDILSRRSRLGPLEVSFPTDVDGFLSQECPSCNHRFKVLFGEGSDAPISYCPYCGYNGQECWHTPEQIEYVQAIATSEVLGPELKKLQRSLGSNSKSLLKFDGTSAIPTPPPPPMETDDELAFLRFRCCNETVKVSLHEQLFCIICGTEISMMTSDSKKVFLSHKGVDKAEVNDYKKTLSQLGYDPWIDEDAMPAAHGIARPPRARVDPPGRCDSLGLRIAAQPSWRSQIAASGSSAPAKVPVRCPETRTRQNDCLTAGEESRPQLGVARAQSPRHLYRLCGYSLAARTLQHSTPGQQPRARRSVLWHARGRRPNLEERQ